MAERARTSFGMKCLSPEWTFREGNNAMCSQLSCPAPLKSPLPSELPPLAQGRSPHIPPPSHHPGPHPHSPRPIRRATGVCTEQPHCHQSQGSAIICTNGGMSGSFLAWGPCGPSLRTHLELLLSNLLPKGSVIHFPK